VKLENTVIFYGKCVITISCCGHTVPWMNVICYHHMFLAEPYCGPPCARTKLKNRVVRPVVEEVGCQAYEKLSLGERGFGKWFYPKESPTLATKL
jgi:hypothetical protein